MSEALNREGISQLYYTTTPNRPPPDHTLLVGELGIELGNPMRLWVGVPAWLDPSGKRLVYDKSSGLEEAPIDGQIYGRRGSILTWQPVLALTGGAMTGPIELPLTPPTLPAHAANKAYVDTQITDAMVTVSDTPPANPRDNSLWWDSAGTQLYLRYHDPSGPAQWVVAVNQSGAATPPPLDGFTYGRTGVAWDRVLLLAGGTLTGTLTLAGPPTNANDAATKAYVDSQSGGAKPAPVTFPFVGKPGANVAVYVPVPMAMTIPSGLAGTVTYADTQATANTVFALSRIRSGSSTITLGTITITPASRFSCTLSGTGGILNAGDILSITGPGTQDATLSDVGITVMASRT